MGLARNHPFTTTVRYLGWGVTLLWFFLLSFIYSFGIDMAWRYDEGV